MASALKMGRPQKTFSPLSALVVMEEKILYIKGISKHLFTYFWSSMSDYIILKNFTQLLKSVESQHLKTNLPKVFVGDSIKLGILIKEGNKERTKYF